ncbi:MAG: TIGR02281 family clan AA aspartic protease [Pseudomonadota bacterium]
MRWPIAIGFGLLFIALATQLAGPGPLDVGPHRPPLTAEELPKPRSFGWRNPLLEHYRDRISAPRRTVITRTNGEFRVEAFMNGRGMRTLVDPRATTVTMDEETAGIIGIRVSETDFDREMETVNGKVRYAQVSVERISIGDISLRNVRARVLQSVLEGDGRRTVRIGMSFLNRLDRFTFTGDRLTLVQ